MAKRVLLVDDDVDFVEITKRQLEKGGFEVDIAYDGQECIEKVEKNRPDLIILDVIMPNLNGYDTCDMLKADGKTTDIPVILLTSVAEQVPKTTYTPRQGMETLADDYIPKPPVFEALMKSIKSLIGE